MRQDHQEGQRTLVFHVAGESLISAKNDSSLTQTMLAAMRLVVYLGIANQETLFRRNMFSWRRLLHRLLSRISGE
ncbi:MAG: hypothetical protein GY896_09770 [Gammaproteobacteria bacterium]|nr:hypothetical protein [Gammaproteobacteria bacterium]